MNKDKELTTTNTNTSESLPVYFNKAQLSYIQQKTPAKYIKQRPGRGGQNFDYVEIGYVIEMLNQVFGFDWDFEITDQQIGKSQLWVRGKLTVRIFRNGQIQTITKSQYGGSDIKFNRSTNQPLSIADDLKSAGSDCLKKCASLLGIAGDVYSKEVYDLNEPVHEQARRARQENEEFTGNAVEGEVLDEPQAPKANGAQITLVRKLLAEGKIKLPENQLEEEYIHSLTFQQAREIIQTNG